MFIKKHFREMSLLEIAKAVRTLLKRHVRKITAE